MLAVNLKDGQSVYITAPDGQVIQVKVRRKKGSTQVAIDAPREYSIGRDRSEKNEGKTGE